MGRLSMRAAADKGFRRIPDVPRPLSRNGLVFRGGLCYTDVAVCTPAGEVARIGAAPKEQPPRKLSGKRTAGGRALWKATAGGRFRQLTEGVSPGHGSPAGRGNLSRDTNKGGSLGG